MSQRFIDGPGVWQQLCAARCEPHLDDVRIGLTSVTARADVVLIVACLRSCDQFQEGVLYGLHRDVGNDLTDFRAYRNAFGRGSLQIVIDQRTGNFYADVDRWSPYEDLVGFVGHAGEVVGNWMKRLGRREKQTHGSV